LGVDHWKFLHAPWPQIIPAKYHRTELNMVNDIDHIKETVPQRLGYIPVFFFLSLVFGTKYYPGPHRNVEKGLLILYHDEEFLNRQDG